MNLSIFWLGYICSAKPKKNLEAVRLHVKRKGMKKYASKDFNRAHPANLLASQKPAHIDPTPHIFSKQDTSGI